MNIETEIKNAFAPINELFCKQCGARVSPRLQTRLTATECGQSCAYICWDCPNCGQTNFTADDLDILDAEIID